VRALSPVWLDVHDFEAAGFGNGQLAVIGGDELRA